MFMLHVYVHPADPVVHVLAECPNVHVHTEYTYPRRTLTKAWTRTQSLTGSRSWSHEHEQGHGHRRIEANILTPIEVN